MIDFANDVCRALANGARDRDAAAYRTGDDVRSYGALWADAQRTAGLLRRQGTGPVLIRGTAHPDTLTAMLACLLAGRAYVPIDPQLPAARAAAIRAQTRSTCTLRSADCAGDGLRLAEMDAFRDAPVQAQPGDTAYIIFTSGSTGRPKACRFPCGIWRISSAGCGRSRRCIRTRRRRCLTRRGTALT